MGPQHHCQTIETPVFYPKKVSVQYHRGVYYPNGGSPGHKMSNASSHYSQNAINTGKAFLIAVSPATTQVSECVSFGFMAQGPDLAMLSQRQPRKDG
ncbi:hypothetical protein AVEN_38270-1 [Araneus ventricosus]|uniref:Uncharacterized protein n=1 Tax=Araneus ventricosus TaxID=182803 RepID=A0A4Y2E5Q3_ARAVE|nr:hypothetical protein AVEN_38270-1 [Araneus ventricosus]